MPFKFAYLCDLLQTLEYPYVRDKVIIESRVKEYTQKEIVAWLKRYRNSLDEFATDDAAVMMMLRPEEWKDRDFGLDADGLEHLLARALALTRAQCAELQKWRTEPHNGDLGVCVERVMGTLARDTINHFGKPVVVEEVDQVLLKIACSNQRSSSEIQALAADLPQDFCPIESLRDIYDRLQPREAKWLTRLVLKNISPVKVPTDFGLGSFHSNLPNILKINVQLPSSVPVGIRLGATGIFKGSKQGRRRRASTPPRDGEYVSSRKRRASPGAIVFKRGILRPIGSAAVANNSFTTPTPATSAPKTSSTRPDRTSPKASSTSRLSQGTPPDRISFQRTSQPTGPLQPRIHPMPTPLSSLAPSAASTSIIPTTSSEAAPPRRSSFIETPLKFPEFKLGLLTPNPTPTGQKPLPSLDPAPTSTPTHTSKSTSSKFLKRSSLKPKPPSPLTTAGTGTCRMTSTTCPLQPCIFLLGPSLPLPYLISGPLAWHGPLYTTIPTHLAHPGLPKHCPQTGLKYRKIALVEGRDIKKTVEFLKEVKGLGLKRDKGRREERVEVCDWRLLEGVAKEHTGKKLGYGVWERCWFCCV